MIKGDEKRNETRVNVKINININKIHIYNKDINLPKPFNIDIKNLSCSGMLFLTKLDIPQNMIFYLNFVINNNIIFMTSEIVWKSYKNGSYNYGCKFTNLSITDERLLRNFVYEQKRKQKIKDFNQKGN